jgi:hypothetical protein
MDLNDIVSYLNTLSPQAAIKYYDLLVEKSAVWLICRNVVPL